MYGLKLTVLLTILTLTISTSVNSETATSGNLLPNAGAGQSSFQNTTDAYAPDKVGSGQGFTIDSGIQAFQNELEAKVKVSYLILVHLLVSQLQHNQVIHLQLLRIV